MAIRPMVAAALVAGILAGAPGCKRQRRSKVTTVEEDQGTLASVINAADPRASIQLVRGFHEIEQNAWRWTRAQFSVALKPPPGAADKGAVLELRFTVPEPVIQQVKGTTLSARVGAAVLEPESYTKPGEYVYKRDLIPAVVGGDAVTIDFTLDRFIAAGVLEGRELGVIVASIGLMTK